MQFVKYEMGDMLRLSDGSVGRLVTTFTGDTIIRVQMLEGNDKMVFDTEIIDNLTVTARMLDFMEDMSDVG